MGPHEQTGALPGEGQTPQLPQHASTRRGGDQLHARRPPPEPEHEHADTQACDSSLQSREEKSVLKPPGLWFSVQQPERRHSGKCKRHLRIRPEVLRDTGCGQPASLATLAGRTIPPVQLSEARNRRSPKHRRLAAQSHPHRSTMKPTSPRGLHGGPPPFLGCSEWNTPRESQNVTASGNRVFAGVIR